MSRLKQQNPQNYRSSGQIHAEFENIIRYLNVAELGDKTVGELLNILFDDSGDFDGPIEMRLDTTAGLQYRVGEFSATQGEDGWITLASISSIRGTTGVNAGSIEGPFFFNRQDIVAIASQTVFAYTMDDTISDLLVYVNGVLQDDAASVYTFSDSNDQVTFGTGLSVNDLVTIYSIRSQSVTNYRRTDLTATSNQAVFAFVHTSDESLLVWVNGIIQRPGGSNDYTNDHTADTVTFVSALTLNDLVTIITVENLTIQNVSGLMFESEFTNSVGLINYAKLNIAAGDIAQAKVVGLVAALANVSTYTATATTPSSPATRDLWLDTSQTPNLLKFYDGTQFLQTSPDSTLPAFLVSNAGMYVRVNGAGTALEYGNIDFSTLVPKTFISAANGVASLDSNGKLPASELPVIFSIDTKTFFQSGTVTNSDIFVARIWKQKIRIDGIAAILSAGTCTVQIKVDGTTVGVTQAVTTTIANVTYGTVIEIDGTTTSKLIEIEVGGASSASNLEVGLAAATVSV
jgi:hypothetical protein